MDVTQFWQLIEVARATGPADAEGVARAVTTALQQLPPEEIIAFDDILWHQMARSYQWDLWAAAYIVNGGCSDDGFDYFRGWLIAQAQTTFEDALRDPDTLVDAVARERYAVNCEWMLGVGADAYEAVTGRELAPASRSMPAAPAGDEWDEDEPAGRAPLLAIQAGCPLDGVRVVVTGRSQRYSRAAITGLLEEMGASVGTTVTRQTTLLLVGEAPGSMLVRARGLGVKILTEADFERLLAAEKSW